MNNIINPELARAIVFLAPAVSAMVSLILATFDKSRFEHPIRRHVRYYMMATYGIIILLWVGLVLHSTSHKAFILFLPIFLSLAMLVYVFIHRLVFIITNTGEREHFPMIHFVIPICLIVVIYMFTRILPFQEQLSIVYAHKKNIAAYLMLSVFLPYSFLYPILSLRMIKRYEREVTDSSANTYLTALRRLFYAILFEMILLPIPICALLLDMKPFIHLGFVWGIAALPSFFVYIILCYNLLLDHYVIVEPVTFEEKIADVNKLHLERNRVEQYMDNEKPFLNPKFRITDMSKDLFTNRTYLSAFINREYGMNFNSFINSYRLREVKKLRTEALRKKQRISAMELVYNAGFNNYRSYLRAKKYGSARV